MARRLVIAAVLLFGLYQAGESYAHRALVRTPGVLIASEPVQHELAAATAIRHGDFTLQPLASFSFDARVLLVSRYRWDAESALAPFDLGIGWRRMSDTSVIDQLGLSQSARFLTWRWADTPPIPVDEITRSAANVHIIPANDMIERQVAALRSGQHVRAHGMLVEANRADGWRWRSSLSREDGGSGACELMYVESLSVED